MPQQVAESRPTPPGSTLPPTSTLRHARTTPRQHQEPAPVMPLQSLPRPSIPRCMHITRCSPSTTQHHTRTKTSAKTAQNARSNTGPTASCTVLSATCRCRLLCPRRTAQQRSSQVQLLTRRPQSCPPRPCTAGAGAPAAPAWRPSTRGRWPPGRWPPACGSCWGWCSSGAPPWPGPR